MSEPRSFREHPLVQLTLVRFREFWREPEAVFWVFIFPVLLTAGLGIAFRNKPPDVAKIGAVAPQHLAALKKDPQLSVRSYDLASGAHALATGRIVLLVVQEADGRVTYRYDETNSEGRVARLMADRALQRAAGAQDAVSVRDQLVRDPGSRYIDFLVPGLLGMNLMGSGMWGLGFTIVDARRKKLLKRLVASPMPRAYYLLSFLLSRLLVLVVEVTVLVGFGVWVFGVPARGRFWELSLLCLLASLCFSALGLLVASRARTIEAVSGLMNFIMLPMWIFSGVFFPAERYPDVALPLIRLLPLTAVIDSFRGNMLQGLHLHELLFPIAVMCGWMVLCFTAALKLFRWR